jgi:hypothetical protein
MNASSVRRKGSSARDRTFTILKRSIIIRSWLSYWITWRHCALTATTKSTREHLEGLGLSKVKLRRSGMMNVGEGGYLSQGRWLAFYIRLSDEGEKEMMRLQSIGQNTKSKRIKKKIFKRIDRLITPDKTPPA